MNDYLVQEEYKEYIRGVRVVRVQAESKQHVLDGDYEDIDIIDELTADGEVEETNIVTDSQYLVNNWKQCVVECDEYGVPTE